MPAKKAASPSSDLPEKIGAPARRALEAEGLRTLAQVAKRSEADLRELHGMGPKALGLLREALAAKGLAFAAPKAPRK
ncbi:MAG TPA: DNA-binding protein [Candidatus Thermoplasmatota archaeon]|nr:DNA-binding protein [Candidatus Thermoplasmatota archaeon]